MPYVSAVSVCMINRYADPHLVYLLTNCACDCITCLAVFDVSSVHLRHHQLFELHRYATLNRILPDSEVC